MKAKQQNLNIIIKTKNDTNSDNTHSDGEDSNKRNTKNKTRKLRIKVIPNQLNTESLIQLIKGYEDVHPDEAVNIVIELNKK